MESNWIFSKKFDLTIFLTPLALALLSPLCLLLGPIKVMPLWAFLLLLVGCDVAHVWATLYRTYMDPVEFRRRPLFYLLPIPIFAFASFRLHLYSPQVFWTILAYVAIYHFIKQNYGFVVLYKVKKGERDPFDFHLDKLAVWAGALGPVLWWHATPTRRFDWFDAGEKFFLRIDPAFIGDILTVYCTILGIYLARQIYLYRARGFFNPGKQMIMAAHFITWAVGIYATDNPLISAAFLNLFHGIPFLGLVWYYCHRKWSDPERSKLSQTLAFISRKSQWLRFYLPLVGLAFLEETVWDGVVWKVYLPNILGLTFPEFGSVALSAWVAILSLPQILHYFLDGWIWKFNPSNPGLREFLNLAHPAVAN